MHTAPNFYAQRLFRQIIRNRKKFCNIARNYVNIQDLIKLLYNKKSLRII